MYGFKMESSMIDNTLPITQIGVTLIYYFIFNQVDLGFISDVSNLRSFDDKTGNNGQIMYDGDKHCFYTGSLNVSNAVIKCCKNQNIKISVQPELILIKG